MRLVPDPAAFSAGVALGLSVALLIFVGLAGLALVRRIVGA